MHFAYPKRKSSNAPQYLPRTSRLPTLRRSRLKVIALAGLAFITLIWLFTGRSHTEPSHIPSGKPPVVIVTVFNEKEANSVYIKSIKENRIRYAEKHGYATLFARSDEYDLKGSPLSWAKVVAMRHAMTKYPDCRYLWYLDEHAFIMNPKLKLEDYLMNPSKLEGLMIKDQAVVPPDSIIKTFSHLKGEDVDFVVTQDKEGLSTGSFVLRNGDWAQFFVDTWFDPLYRSYNFQKAETHALEHIVQWHPTILSKLALVPQRTMNAYSRAANGEEYQNGDLAVRFAGCAESFGEKSCVKEAERYSQKWQTSFTNA